MFDLDAIDARHDAAILVGRKLDTEPLDDSDLAKLFSCASDVVTLMVYVSEMETKIKNIEAPDSPLCNCREHDDPPTNPNNGILMDHHCECPAVMASAAMLGAHRLTRHAFQCVCTSIYDK